jgi:tripartite-type tricarboxylate transporter receptor subunit TctC
MRLKSSKYTKNAACVILLSTLAVGLPSVNAAEFYSKKTIKLVVGSGAGGGYDMIARVIAKGYGKHIDGNPNVIVTNMPGAGGVKMTNWAYNVAPKNGTILGMPLMPVALNQHLRPKKVRYDATKLNWIGNVEESDSMLFTWHTSKTKTFKDAMKRSTTMGGSGKSSPIYQLITLSNKLLGTKFKIILGYKGAHRYLAIEKGEVEGSFSTIQNIRAAAPHWYSGGKDPVQILMVNSKKRFAEIPEVPTMSELAKTPEDKKIFEYIMLQSLTGRAVFAPPGVPKGRVASLRKGMDRNVKDPAFISDMARAKLKVTYSTGAEVARSVQQLVDMPPAVVKRIRKLVK